MNGRLDGSDTEHKTFLSAQKQSDEFVGTEPEEVVAWRYQIHERNIWNATRNQQQIPSPSGWWGVLCQKAREIVALAKRHFEEARSNREQSRAIESNREQSWEWGITDVVIEAEIAHREAGSLVTAED